MMLTYKCISQNRMQQHQHQHQQQQQQQQQPANTIVIEAWIHPLSCLTPSLIMHNLELQGIRLPQALTIAIDRGHCDCTGTNYAVITVRTEQEQAQQAQQAQSFYCSFFSQKAARGMDPAALHQCWLGNCYLHVDKGPVCSFRHESGHAKTWRKMAPIQCFQDQDHQDQEDAVSVDPICPKSKDAKNIKSKDAKSKDKLRIIQLQKKNLVLRTDLDALKSEFKAMKESLVEQEAITKRANQCMQDWANKQLVERVWILETQHAQKHKSLNKKMKRLSERLDQLENKNENINSNITNPFDFQAVYNYYDQCHYNEPHATCDDECPALELIQNYYADTDPEAVIPTINELNEPNEPNDIDNDNDDDIFELIQIELVHDDCVPK